MTVNELDVHFDFYPDEIIFYDKTANIQDSVSICNRKNGVGAFSENAYDTNAYNDFLNDFGKKEVVDWSFGWGNVLNLELR